MHILTKDCARRFNLSIFRMIWADAVLFMNATRREAIASSLAVLRISSSTTYSQGIHTTQTAIKNQAAEVADAVKPPTLR
jgi:hypothetical protein